MCGHRANSDSTMPPRYPTMNLFHTFAHAPMCSLAHSLVTSDDAALGPALTPSPFPLWVLVVFVLVFAPPHIPTTSGCTLGCQPISTHPTIPQYPCWATSLRDYESQPGNAIPHLLLHWLHSPADCSKLLQGDAGLGLYKPLVSLFGPCCFEALPTCAVYTISLPNQACMAGTEEEA